MRSTTMYAYTNSQASGQADTTTTQANRDNGQSQLVQLTKRSLQHLCGGFAVSVCLSILAATQAVAGSYSITKIADTRSDLTSINNSAAINDSGTVAFFAKGGVYTSDGTVIAEIINSNQLPPLFDTKFSSGTGPISYSFGPLLSINNNGTIAFLTDVNQLTGTRDPSGQSLLIVGQGGSLTTRESINHSDRLTNINLTNLALNDRDEVAYLRVTNRTASFITRDLVFSRANQPNVTIATSSYTPEPYSAITPPEAPFSTIADVAINNTGEVTFAATQKSTGTSGIFTSLGGEFTSILETPASALGVNDKGDIVVASGDAIRLFDRATGTLHSVADTRTSFNSFSTPAINNNDMVAFTATFNFAEKGIFTGADPIKDKVIATGDSLDGSTVVDLNFLRSGLNNLGQIAFYARLADGTSGVFRAEPSDVETPAQPPLPSVEDAFPVRQIVDTNTPVPGGSGNFSNFNIVSVDGDNVVFSQLGILYETLGIYKSSSGVLSTIADSNTPIPNGSGTFTNFNYYGFYLLGSGNNVVFQGGGNNQQSGTYISRDGDLQVVADLNTPIPGGTGNFNGFGISPADNNFQPLVIDGNSVAFEGKGISGQDGIYISRDGDLQVVADGNTPIPGGTGNFKGFDSVVFNGNHVAFIGVGASSQRGIYISRDGTLQVVADTNTPIPGGTKNFTYLSNFQSNGNNILFSANNGIYISRDGSLQVVADTNTPIPGGSGNFYYLRDSVLDKNNVVFQGSDTSFQESGIYISRDGNLQVVVDKNTTVPGSTKKFSSFSNLLVDGNTVVFLGYVKPSNNFSDIPVGIYASINGSLFKVVDLTSRIDGKNIPSFSSFIYSSTALRGNSLVFKATFSDGTQAILQADLSAHQ